MGKSNDPPPAPDPSRLISAQTQANRINTYTPFGSATYGGPNRQNLRISLSPQQQNILNQQQQLQSTLAQRGTRLAQQLPSDALNFEGLPGYVSQVDIGDNPMANSVFQAQRGLLDPYLAEQQEAMQQQLANRGIPIGSEAYERATRQLSDQQGRQLAQASLGSLETGINTQFRNAALQNQARQQGIAERQALRGNQFNELAAIMGGTQVQTPQFSQPSPVDVMGPYGQQYQGQLAGWQNQQANRQATLGGLFSLGGSLGSAAIMGGLF